MSHRNIPMGHVRCQSICFSGILAGSPRMELSMLVPMPPTLDQIARSRIKSWIETTHITQAELGARIGKDQPWVSTYLAGHIDADMETLRKIAEVFGHTFSTLFAQPTNPKFAKFFEDYLALPPRFQAHLEGMAADLRGAIVRPPRRRRRG